MPYSKEKEIVGIAGKKRMPKHLIVYLLAMYRAGLNIKAVHTFEDKIELAIESLVKNEQRWQDLLISEGMSITFPEFLAYRAGPYGTGWTSEIGWCGKLETQLSILEEEQRNGFK